MASELHVSRIGAAAMIGALLVAVVVLYPQQQGRSSLQEIRANKFDASRLHKQIRLKEINPPRYREQELEEFEPNIFERFVLPQATNLAKMETPGLLDDGKGSASEEEFPREQTDVARVKASEQDPLLIPTLDATHGGVNDRQVLQWEADLDWRLQKMDEKLQQEVEAENQELAREERLLVVEKEKLHTGAPLAVWTAFVCLLLLLVLLLACCCWRFVQREHIRQGYSSAEIRKQAVDNSERKQVAKLEEERTSKELRITPPPAVPLHVKAAQLNDLLDRHASIRAASARIVSSSHVRAEEETRRDNLLQGAGAGGRGWGVQVQLPPLPTTSFPPMLAEQLSSSKPETGGSVPPLPAHQLFSPIAQEERKTEAQAPSRETLPTSVAASASHPLPATYLHPSRTQMVQTSPRILASPRLPLAGGASSDWLFGSRWQWFAGGQAEGVAELCADGSFRAASAGQHAHWWLDEQGRLNVEWGNRLGLHVLVVDKGRGRLTGMRSNGNVPVEAQLLATEGREQEVPPSSSFSPRMPPLPLISEDSSRRSENESLEWSSMLYAGEESGDAVSGSPKR
uniref:Uncharacterized protein n=1 Tax=Hanusia phi TaxID=3032 RepID=A0A7S0I085_9CRYP|mmetsp:Transcript_7357/g.16786  ORF Transcript_7357/g.16786 Transcript_7357/m.16786 type:complete len:571 (+) Transcript_7357:93-1805(+)